MTAVSSPISGPPDPLPPRRPQAEVHRHHLHRLLEVQRGERPGVGIQRALRASVGEQGENIRLGKINVQ